MAVVPQEVLYRRTSMHETAAKRSARETAREAQHARPPALPCTGHMASGTLCTTIDVGESKMGTDSLK